MAGSQLELDATQALVVASQSFSDPKVEVMVIVVAMLMPFARWLGDRMAG